MGSSVAFGSGVAATLVAWLCGAGSTPPIGLVLLTGVAAVVGAFTTVPGALVGAVQCWALYDGFVAHRLGELSFAGSDLTAMAVVLGAGMVGVAVGWLSSHAPSETSVPIPFPVTLAQASNR